MWYQDWFADERYLALYEHRDDAEAEQLLDLIDRVVRPAKDARILDLACGAGRHSIVLAKRGYINITGVDLSSTLIAKAQAETSKLGLRIDFVESDMRFFKGEYDLVLNIFTSFGYFESDADNKAVIERIATSLASNGAFVLDFLNAKFVQATLNPHSMRKLAGGEEVEEFREISGGRVNKRISICGKDCSKEYNESVRLFDHLELDHMITNSGLKVEKMFGSYGGEAFSAERSPRCIIIAKNISN